MDILLTFKYIVCFILGACLGSFANVCILRWLEEKSITGRSKCPTCKNTIQWYDLFPILSWFLLKGKCRYCKNKIRPRYLILEILLCPLIKNTKLV